MVNAELRSRNHDKLYILCSSTFPIVAALTLRTAEGIKVRLAG